MSSRQRALNFDAEICIAFLPHAPSPLQSYDHGSSSAAGEKPLHGCGSFNSGGISSRAQHSGEIGKMAAQRLFHRAQVAVEPGQGFFDEFVPGRDVVGFIHLQLLVARGRS